MSDNSHIEWTDATWNPVTGCTKVSAGCDNCYAETFAERFRGVPGHHFEQGFDMVLRPGRLDHPLRWRRPRRVFVNSMSDLFHEAIPDEYIARVFGVMAAAHQHTFQVLTKRHGRMRSLLGSQDFQADVFSVVDNLGETGLYDEDGWWPLLNVWLGVSVEDQRWADIRIPALLDTPAAVRWISAEPLLGPVDLNRWLLYQCPQCDRSAAWTDGRSLAAGDEVDEYWCQTCGAETPLVGCEQPGLNWVVTGGESGGGARPMHPDWARSLRAQCTAAGVPFLFKQWGAWRPGGHPATPACWIGRDGQATYAGADYGAAVPMVKVGKKEAGRELDGRTWDEYPLGATDQRHSAQPGTDTATTDHGTVTP
jgi:protein gp37